MRQEQTMRNEAPALPKGRMKSTMLPFCAGMVHASRIVLAIASMWWLGSYAKDDDSDCRQSMGNPLSQYNGLAASMGARTSAKNAVFVDHILCDDWYGRALETAMYEGNLREMWALLSSHEHTIDEVIAVTIHGNGAGGECSQQNVTYTNDRLEGEQMDALRSQRQSGMMGVYGGTAFVTFGEGSSTLQTDYSSGAGLKGEYYKCGGIGITIGRTFGTKYPGTVAILGTPLMIAARAGRKKIVKELLARGANPNVFIHVKNYYFSDICFSAVGSIKRNLICDPWKCPRSDTYLCALLDCYMTEALMGRDSKTSREERDEIAKMLLEHGAGFIKEADEYGRNMLWDIARIDSPYLLREMVKRGFNVDHEDNQGNTIQHYCEDGGVSTQFLRELERLGVKRKGIPSNDQQKRPHPTLVSQVKPMPPSRPSHTVEQMLSRQTMQDGHIPVPQQQQVLPSTPRSMQKPDNSVEIAALQHRLLALRMELEEARANRKDATVQGTGWVTASMYELRIVQEIRDCERRIMELR